MMARLILHLQYKTFNMKFYLVILSFFLIGFTHAQIMPQSFISNNNAYPISTSGADVAFNFETAISSAAASPSPPIKSGSSTYPAIKSDFSFNLFSIDSELNYT